MTTIRSALIGGVLALLCAMIASPTLAQTYTYDGLPAGIAAAAADGAPLRPTTVTSVVNPRPTVTGRVAVPGSVTVTIGSTTVTVTTDASGQFTVAVPGSLAPGNYPVSFNGAVVGTLGVAAPGPTPLPPLVGSGASLDSGSGLPLLPIAVLAAAIGLIAFYAVRHRHSVAR